MFQVVPAVLASAALACTASGGASSATTPASEMNAASSPAASSADASSPAALPALPKEVESFDYVWNAIDRTHWDPEKAGALWDTARAELRPKILAATTKIEANAVLQELIGRLGQSHFVISGGESPDDLPLGGKGTLNFEVRLIDDAVVVWRRSKGAPKNVATGMIVDSVNGRSWAEVLKHMRSKDRASSPSAPSPSAPSPSAPSPSAYEEASMANRFVRGAIGSKATLKLIDGKRATTIVPAIWSASKIATIAGFGYLQGIPLEYESKAIGKSVGYIRLSVFFDPVKVNRRFREDIKRFSGKDGLVLDLRGNPGGLGGMAMGLGGRLVQKSGQKLGTMISKDSKLNFVLNPQPGSFAGKVAILVDGQCASTCEIFAAGLEDIDRATAFGTRTAGAALPSQVESLPNGALFQYATANYVSVSGRVLEHDGLTPRRVVPLTRKSLLAGKDDQLDAALAWIRE